MTIALARQIALHAPRRGTVEPIEMAVLLVLDASDKPCPFSDLMHTLNLPTATLSDVLRVLSTKGLAEVARSRRDHRVHDASITPKGKRLLRTARRFTQTTEDEE